MPMVVEMTSRVCLRVSRSVGWGWYMLAQCAGCSNPTKERKRRRKREVRTKEDWKGNEEKKEGKKKERTQKKKKTHRFRA